MPSVAGSRTLQVIDDVVDRIARVMDAVLQALPHVALGVFERVPGAVQRVVDVACHVLHRVLDLAVLARSRVAGHLDRAAEATLEGSEIGLHGVEHAAGGVGHGAFDVTEEAGHRLVGRDGVVVQRLLDLADHVVLGRGDGADGEGRGQREAGCEAEGVGSSHW